MAKATAKRSPVRSQEKQVARSISDLDFDDPRDDEGPDGLHEKGKSDEGVAPRGGEKRRHVAGIDRRDGKSDAEGEQRHDAAGQFALGGQRVDEALDLDP